MEKQVVLLDNSSFAGVMRCLHPSREEHESFASRFPAHRQVDERSFKEFLTALCIFDMVQMDSICTGDRNLGDPYGDDNGPTPASWVGDMLALLPSELNGIVKPYVPPDSPVIINHSYACETAYDLFCSDVRNKVGLRPDERLPSVYSSHRYVFLPEFERINASRGHALAPDLLAQAMFLHRGLYLQSRAHQAGYTYWPYLYRGRMLSSLSPLVSTILPTYAGESPTASQVFGVRPTDDTHLKILGKFYRQLMSDLRWVSFEDGVPFIGESIFAGCNGDASRAIETALEFRERGGLLARWNLLRSAVRENGKLKRERILREIKQDFAAAAAHLGHPTIGRSNLQPMLKLASSVVPRGFSTAAEAAVSMLPGSAREWGIRIANRLLTKNSFHMMFIDHYEGLKTG